MSLARIPRLIAAEIGANPAQVTAAVELLDGGATVPFIARYRKEVTGGLDDTQLRKLEERLSYLRELEARRAAILESITEPGQDDRGAGEIHRRGRTKAELEDIYLPYKPKRRTKAMIAREAGCRGWSMPSWPTGRPIRRRWRAGFLSEGFADTKAALEGARDILAEGLSEDAALLGRLRDHMRKVGGWSRRWWRGQGTGGGQVQRLFRPFRALCGRPFATGRWPCCAAATRKS
jgi:uncharacterized protein